MKPANIVNAALTLVLLVLIALFNSTLADTLTKSTTYAGQTDVLAAQKLHLKRVHLTVEAPVLKLLSDDTVGIPHQRFLLQLTNGTTVLVAHDTQMAPRVPVRAGDIVTIHGEYIWNEKGGVIHWTHHSNSTHHEPGWIEFNGQRYQ
ncbi:MAG: DUF3465 domain-containing protein [Candidatus Melainabacteria bacterium]|nr:DUF3465 domain-containing protein [Candidatus Melainabacteria bacterium]